MSRRRSNNSWRAAIRETRNVPAVSHTCGNRLNIRRDALEASILNGLRQHLMDEDLCKEFCEEYARHMSELTKRHNASLHQFERELERTDRELDKMVDAILQGLLNPSLLVTSARVFLKAHRTATSLGVKKGGEDA